MLMPAATMTPSDRSTPPPLPFMAFDLPKTRLEVLQVAALLEAGAPEPTLPPDMMVRRLLQLQPSAQVRARSFHEASSLVSPSCDNGR
jgi:hypothetical protein